jgi:sugar O-acyltransferase (sialic acid O-acetyltransferase NeuD family)
MTYVLIGAGGHARAIVEGIDRSGGTVVAYVDPRESRWLSVRRISEQALSAEIAAGAGIVIGIGGVTPESLEKRLSLLEGYRTSGMPAPAVVHPRAHVSSSAILEQGTIVLAGAVIQPGVMIHRGGIVNTGAIVEHDSEIGAGSHIAPGAIVLGGCRIGRCCMIGAGAVILPGTTVADRSLVAAATRYPS